jgi:hypothetical protein
MTKQMCWLSANSESPKQLYLRHSLQDPWKLYKKCSEYVPDYLVENGSHGYATQQVLMTKGWKLVSSEGQSV